MKTLDQLIQQLSDEAKKCRKSIAYFRKRHGEPENSETWNQLNRIVEDDDQIVKYLKELKRYRDASGFSGKLEKFREQKED